MKGIILAGGQGTRLHPVTLEIPKPLITIKKKPLLNYNLELLAAHGIKEVKIIIRPGDRDDYNRWYEHYAQNFPGLRIGLTEEPEPMGTLGYALHHLRQWMANDAVFVVNGDGIIKNLDLTRMLSSHQSSGALATISVMPVESAGEYGSVQTDGATVTGFSEKNKEAIPGMVSAGMYIVTAAAFDRLGDAVNSGNQFLMFEKDLFPVLATQRHLGAFVSDGKFYDCGTFARWEQAIREV